MRAFLALLTLPLALAACEKPKTITVSDGWVRLAAVPGRPAAAYFIIHGGPGDATLMTVDSPVAIHSEMHQSMGSGGMSGMKPLTSLAVPARAEIKFAPGGNHVMLFDVNPGIKPGSTVPLTFTFTNGYRLVHNATAIGAGDPAPKN